MRWIHDQEEPNKLPAVIIFFSWLYESTKQPLNNTVYSERHGSVVVSTSAWHTVVRGSIPGSGILYRLKTWLSTLEAFSVSSDCLIRKTQRSVSFG